MLTLTIIDVTRISNTLYYSLETNETLCIRGDCYDRFKLVLPIDGGDAFLNYDRITMFNKNGFRELKLEYDNWLDAAAYILSLIKSNQRSPYHQPYSNN